MKRNILDNFLLYNLIVLIMASCNNDGPSLMEASVFKVSTEMLKLTNDSTAIAGTIEIMADVPEVELEWFVSPECKLNTQFSKLYLENGKAQLPIEWLKPFEEGIGILSSVSFNAGVKIKAGSETKYVSLVWGEKEDHTFIERMKTVTRTDLNDTKASSITVSQQQVKMNYQTGGASVVSLNNVASAVVDYSAITPSMNIKLADLPLVLTESKPLIFSWDGSAPTTSFAVDIIIYGTDVPAVTIKLIYEASGNPGPGPTPGDDLKVSTIVPGGDIPDEGGTYYCNFTGTYTGTALFRATSDGLEVARTSGNVPSLMQVVVPGITGKTSAQIGFEYSRDGGTTWIPIETRKQNQENLAIYPIKPEGYIPAAGATVTSSLYGTYSKKIAIHARIGGTIIASGSGSVPSTVSLQIPANTDSGTRVIIFEYSKNGGPWLTMEPRRQLGR